MNVIKNETRKNTRNGPVYTERTKKRKQQEDVTSLVDCSDEKNKKRRPCEMLKLVVGGANFATRRETLQKHPNTRLADLDKTSEFYNKQTDEFVFDRDPQVFPFILNFYRTSELHLPSGICGNAIKNELKFWQISQSTIAECCWRVMHDVDEDDVIFSHLEQQVELETTVEEVKGVSALRVLRHKIYLILVKPNSSTAAKVWNFIYIILVFASGILLALTSVPSLRQKYSFSDEFNITDDVLKNSTNYKFILYAYYGLVPGVYVLENFLVGVFTVELLLRFLVYYDKKRFFFSILNWIDVISTVSGFGAGILDLLFTHNVVHPTHSLYVCYFALQCVMVFRLVRFFRLQERYSGLKIMLLVIQKSARDLGLLILCFIVVSTIFGTMQYYCAFENQRFSSIPLAVWWAIITMTTVGYGDYYPETGCGYLLGTITAMCGIIFLSIPIALIAVSFNDYYLRHQQRELFAEKKKYLERKKRAWAEENRY